MTTQITVDNIVKELLLNGFIYNRDGGRTNPLVLNKRYVSTYRNRPEVKFSLVVVFDFQETEKMGLIEIHTYDETQQKYVYSEVLLNNLKNMKTLNPIFGMIHDNNYQVKYNDQ
jgi:hypothetical protein